MHRLMNELINLRPAQITLVCATIASGAQDQNKMY